MGLCSEEMDKAELADLLLLLKDSAPNLDNVIRGHSQKDRGFNTGQYVKSNPGGSPYHQLNS